VDEASTLDPAAQRAYLINCLAAAHGALAQHACCQGRARGLAKALDGQLAGLVGGAAGRLLGGCGLAEAAERVRLYRARGAGGGAMAADPALRPERLAGALRAACALVSRPDALPEFGGLQAPRIRAQAVAGVAAALAGAYADVHAALADPASGYAAGAADGLEPPDAVRTILGVA